MKNKKILIIGGTGFVGSWLSIFFSFLKANIEIIGLKDEKINKISSSIVFKKNIKCHYINIKDKKKILKVCQKFKPEVILHLASEAIVINSYKDIFKTFNTNVNYTINIFEIFKTEKYIKKIIIFTSDKVYKNNSNIYLSEKDPLGGDDPYSCSKSCQDLVAQMYQKQLKERSIYIIRAGNIFGGGDFVDYRLIPDIYKNLKSKKITFIRSPHSIRPWQHIFDICLKFNKLLKYNKKNLILNLGPPKKNQKDVKHIIGKILKINRNKIKLNFLNKKRNFEEKRILKLNSNKANFIFGKNILSLDNGIQYTDDWYKSFLLENKDPFIITENQIKNFFAVINGK